MLLSWLVPGVLETDEATMATTFVGPLGAVRQERNLPKVVSFVMVFFDLSSARGLGLITR